MFRNEHLFQGLVALLIFAVGMFAGAVTMSNIIIKSCAMHGAYISDERVIMCVVSEKKGS